MQVGEKRIQTPPSLHAAPQTRTTCLRPGSLILSLSLSLSYPNFPLRPILLLQTTTPHPGKKRGGSKIQKHMWLAIKLHMHSVYPDRPLLQLPPTSTPHPPSPTQHQPTPRRKVIQRGDVETMGWEEATSGNNLSCLWWGAKTKERDGGVGGGGGGGTMATVREKVTAGYHSCTGQEQCPSCGLVGRRWALGEIQDKRKHQRRTIVIALLYKGCFSFSCREDAHRVSRHGPSSYQTSRPQQPFSSDASDTAALHHWQIEFLASNISTLSSSFPKAFVRYIISTNSICVFQDGNVIALFFSSKDLSLNDHNTVSPEANNWILFTHSHSKNLSTQMFLNLVLPKMVSRQFQKTACVLKGRVCRSFFVTVSKHDIQIGLLLRDSLPVAPTSTASNYSS